MNLLFDLIATQPEKSMKYHGGSEYAKAVFWRIVPKTEVRLCCIFDAGRYLDEEIKNHCLENELPLIDITEISDLNKVIDTYSIDKFFSALPFEKIIQERLPVKSSVKSIITIHGLRNLELPFDSTELRYAPGVYNRIKYYYKRLFPVRNEERLLLRIGKMIRNYSDPTIITVSEYSGLSLKYFLPEIPDSSVHVLYSPISYYTIESNSDSIHSETGLETNKYFLLLSAGIWQKNSFRMLSAIENLLNKNLVEDYKFVIIGAPEIIKRKFQDVSFIFLDYLDRQELEVLLKNAHALLYPSLNEGFGYPPLEAFKYGTGVLASAIGPVQEICGRSALYFNPYSLTEMKIRILQSIKDQTFCENIQPRIDQYNHVRQRQIKDLDSLASLICN